MRLRIRLSRDGESFIARLSPYHADVLHRALTCLRARQRGDTALAVQVGAGAKAVDALAARLAGDHARSFDLRLSAAEVHVLHSALTAAPLMFLDGRDRLFSEELFHRETGSFREHFDALARSLVEEVSKA
ncbi:hypothetical protein [Streptomyces sp. S.PNR 29]|uniref:hypothetical protein n=1 Tax=Streptomyces sp. S.PNR 29 TaxID=2973805 RepID=UPI0025AF7896|nr:hypothetical protein [Streptomyces sp. S.PNR 29]MDN0197239.1 hypothetical protein [Streptomyces sp. S.PNR 29]